MATGLSRSNPCSAVQLVKQSHLMSYFCFVEDLLRAAGILETSLKILLLLVAARELPCVQIVLFFHLTHDKAWTKDLCSITETMVVLQKAESDVETTKRQS